MNDLEKLAKLAACMKENGIELRLDDDGIEYDTSYHIEIKVGGAYYMLGNWPCEFNYESIQKIDESCKV